MNHIRIYHINYYILFRHQSGRRQSHEFYSAVKRLVRMSRIFFVSAILGHFNLFRGGVGWVGIAPGTPGRRPSAAKGPGHRPRPHVGIYVFMYVCIYVCIYYIIIYYIILLYIISYYIIYYIIYYILYHLGSLLSLFPVKFLILALLNSLSWPC